MVISKFLNPKNDIAFLRLFGSESHKDIFIHFINDILFFRGKDQIEEVEFLSTIQQAAIASNKESIVDVLCTDGHAVQITVERQVAHQKGFEKRAQYYASKAYSRQLNKGDHLNVCYHNLKEVIFIAITDYTVFPDKEAYIFHHAILDRATYAHDLKDFSFTFIELPKFPIATLSDSSSIVEKWCYFFKYALSTKASDVDKIIGSDTVLKQAYEALNRFNWSEQELFTYEKELKRVRDNRAVEEYMIEKATQRGMEKGRLEIAKTMLLKNYPIEDIMSLTGLSQPTIQDLM